MWRRLGPPDGRVCSWAEQSAEALTGSGSAAPDCPAGAPSSFVLERQARPRGATAEDWCPYLLLCALFSGQAPEGNIFNMALQ